MVRLRPELRRRLGAEAGVMESDATVHPRPEEVGADSSEEAGAAELDHQRWIPPGEEQEEGGQHTTSGEFFTICYCWTTFYVGG